jgi:acyl-coenzyme A thioesterase PaaI-like protein
MAMLDIAAQAQLIAHIGDAQARVSLISSHADFLRSGQAEALFASAQIRRAGRRYASVEAQVWQSDRARLTATAHVQFNMPAPL